MPWEGAKSGSKPPKYARLVDHFIKQVPPTMKKIARDMGDVVVDNTEANTPLGVEWSDREMDTVVHGHGHLRNQIRRRALEIYDEDGVKVYESGAQTNVDYAPYVEEGTGLWGPHHQKYKIEPKTPGGMLAWTDHKTGKRVFAKFVMHPGSPGQHMFAIGVAASEAEFNEVAEEALHDFRRRCEDYKDEGGYAKVSKVVPEEDAA